METEVVEVEREAGKAENCRRCMRDLRAQSSLRRCSCLEMAWIHTAAMKPSHLLELETGEEKSEAVVTLGRVVMGQAGEEEDEEEKEAEEEEEGYVYICLTTL